jgi:hypothetical protein
MPGSDLFKSWLDLAAYVLCQRAARIIPAALWRTSQVRYGAGNTEKVLFHMCLWPSLVKSDGVGVVRRREDSGDIRFFDDFAGVHYHDAIAQLGHHA